MTDCISRIAQVLNKHASLLSNQDDLVPYNRGTEGFSNNSGEGIVAIVKPYNTEDVSCLLNLANELSSIPDLRFTVNPISTGLNWGYGTSQPPRCNSRVVILDLSSLTNIEFTADLGLITVEPGVTQKQLSDFLIGQGDSFMVPVTGAGPSCSILSNAIERGYGITPNTDHFGAVTAIHGYWANGTKYTSAINELDQSEEKIVDKTYKWGVGPYLDGLFTQSNFGVATSMTIRLAKKPEKFVSFIIRVPSDSDMEQATLLIRKVLSDYEGIVGSINLMDKRRLLSMFADNPSPSEHKVMSDELIKTLSDSLQTSDWTIMGSIYGTEGVAKIVKKEIKQIFSQLNCSQIYSDSAIFPIANKVIKWTPNFLFKHIPVLSLVKKQLASFERGKEIMLGRPNKMALKLAYWRHKDAKKIKPEDLSPAKDGCGLLWYAPLVTMNPTVMRKYVEFIRATCPKYNIEPLVTFTNLKHDCVDSTIPIIFDLSNPQAVEDAHNCLKDLVLNGLKLGFVPYRLNIDQQQWLLDANSPFWQTTNKIKLALDPNQILNIGRYNPQ
ncbi:MAG: FAD-binding protein [Colwellia sp.]|nr:FAD-binding protein [Colwellia sp.]